MLLFDLFKSRNDTGQHPCDVEDHPCLFGMVLTAMVKMKSIETKQTKMTVLMTQSILISSDKRERGMMIGSWTINAHYTGKQHIHVHRYTFDVAFIF